MFTHHVAISVRDLQKTIEFYGRFGFQLLLRWDSPDGSLNIAHLGGVDDGVILEVFRYAANSDALSLDPSVGNNLEEIGVKHFGVRVADLSASHGELSAELGERVTQIQHGRTGIEYFFVRDPDGMWVEVVQDDRQLDPANPTYLP